MKPEDLRASSRDDAESDTCQNVNCAPCPPYEGDSERPYYGARCSNQQCELFDVRDTELALCESDADCLLREGLECCQCASAGPWVALNTQLVATLNYLGCAPGECPKCDSHAPKDDLRASCVGGRCVVSKATP